MMADYFETMANVALHEAEKITPEQLKRQVILALKEVHRDTRHAAVEIMNAAEHDVLNIRFEE